MSSEGKFFSKLKKTFKGDKSNESSPNSSPKASKSASKKETNPKKEKLLQEARKEGEKVFHHKHEGSTTAAAAAGSGVASGGTGTGTGTGAGAGVGAATTTSSSPIVKTGNKEHDNILKEAWDEGRKLFHHQAKTGNTGVFAGGTAPAAAAAGGIGGYGASGDNKNPSSGYEYSSNPNDVVTSSSKGRLVTSPPRRSREPLKYEIPGDYSNQKSPTDPTVVADENSKEHSNPAVLTNTDPAYSDDAKPAKGHGKFFDPRDTQGGVLGAATASEDSANAYNEGNFRQTHEEATKAQYVDTDNLKTKPTVYEQEDRANEALEEIKQDSYREGNQQGRHDTQEDPSILGSRQVGGKGTTTDDQKLDKEAIHQENKSAYNKDGVAGILEKEQGELPQKSKKKESHPGTVKEGDVVYGGAGVATARQDDYDPVDTERRISDLDRQINQTDSKIEQLRNDPSNASTFAVRDEPIKTPKLDDVHDEYDHSDGHDEFADAQTDSNSNDNAKSGQGVLAGAGGALAAAAGYLGYGNSREQESTNQGVSQGEKQETLDASYAAGQQQFENEKGGISSKDAASGQNQEGIVERAAEFLGFGSSKDQGRSTEGVTAGQKQETLDASYAAGQQNFENEKAGATTRGATGQNQEGFVERAEGAIGGAAAAAAGYLGFGGHNAREGHQQLLNEAYEAGKRKGENERTGTTSRQTSGQNQEGFVERAEGAIGGAAAAAAGYLGLGPRDPEQERQQIRKEAYEAGRKKGEQELSPTGTSTSGSYLEGTKQRIGEASTAAAGALGLNSAQQPKEFTNEQYGRSKDVTDNHGAAVSRGDKLERRDEASTRTSQSSNQGYLGAAGAAVAGAGAAVTGALGLGGNNSKHNDADDSLIQDAEKADPSIEKLPPHKVNKKELEREETLAPTADDYETEIVESNKDSVEDKQLKAAEGDVSKWNKQHGFTNPKESLIQEAEEADPSIEKLPPHKVNKKELKEEKTLSADADPVEKDVVEDTQFKDLEDDVATYNKKHGFTNVKSSLIEVAENADPKIEKMPAHRGQSVDKELASAGNEPSGNDVQNLPSNYPAVTTDEIKSAAGAGAVRSSDATSKKSIDTGKSSSNVDDGKDREAFDKGGLDGKSAVTGVAGAGAGAAAYGATSHHTSDSTKSQKLDDALKKSLYEEGYSNGKSDATPSSSHNKNVAGASYNTTQPLNRSVGASSVGTAAAASGAYGAGQSLDNDLKKQLYEHGYRSGATKSQVIDPELRQQLYQHGYSTGQKHHQSSNTAYGSTGGIKGTDSNLDSKLKQDLYEHGYAKGSTEKKAEKDDNIHNRSYGTSNREAAIVGGAGAAGVLAGASALGSGHHSQSNQKSLHTPIDSKSELVDENTAHREREDNSNNLVVEVVGIEDKEEALRTARNASKKLDEKGVDLTSGKLVIDANNKEIYKEDYVSEREVHGIGSAPNVVGQSRAEGYTQGARGLDTSYEGDGAGQQTNIYSGRGTSSTSGAAPPVVGQSRAEGYTQGAHGLDTSYEGDGAGQQTNIYSGQGKAAAPQVVGQSRTEGYTQGTRGLDTSYEGEGAGQQTNIYAGQSKAADPRVAGQSRAQGYTQGATDTSYRGEGSGKTTNVSPEGDRGDAIAAILALDREAAPGVTYGDGSAVPELKPGECPYFSSIGQPTPGAASEYHKQGVPEHGAYADVIREAYAAGHQRGQQAVGAYGQGSRGPHGADTSYEGAGVGAKTCPYTGAKDQTTPSAANYYQDSQGAHGSREIDTSYEGDGAGAKTCPYKPTQQGQFSDQSELAKQRLHEAARQNAGLSAGGAGAGATAGAGTGATDRGQHHTQGGKSTSSVAKEEDDEIFVNVKGTKDNTIATKIARTAVARLQKTHASIISKVKELQVDAHTGIVRDENGDEIAHFADLAVDSKHSEHHAGASKSTSHTTHSGNGNTSTAGNSGSAAAGAGAGAGVGAGGLAAAAATTASSKHPHLTEPTHHTSANAGQQYTTGFSKPEPPYPQGVPATKDANIATGHASSDHQSSTVDEGSNVKSSSDNSRGVSSGLPSHSNYDDRQANTASTGYYKSGNENATSSSQGGLSGLASSIIGASGAAGALESLGIGNPSGGSETKEETYNDRSQSDSNPSSSHLSGSNAYPKSAVDAYSSSSENTSFDRKVNDAASYGGGGQSGRYADHHQSSTSSTTTKPSNYVSESSYGANPSSGINTTSAGETGVGRSTGGHSTSAAGSGYGSTTTGSGEYNKVPRDLHERGATGSNAAGSSSHGLTSNAAEVDHEASSANNSFSMPGGWN
ncbi:unnamed protein product [Candida parapsilosis]